MSDGGCGGDGDRSGGDDGSGGGRDGVDAKRRRGGRWGARVAAPPAAVAPAAAPPLPMVHPVPIPVAPAAAAVVAPGPPAVVRPSVSEEDAAAALISSASARRAERDRARGEANKRLKTSSFPKDDERRGRRPRKGAGDDGDGAKAQPSDRTAGEAGTGEPAPPPEEPERANFGLSGALASDAKTGNLYKGVQLKFREPPEARVPATRWRLYVFRRRRPEDVATADQDKVEGKNGGELLETLHISRQSAYLFGRDPNIADVLVSHPSLSKQHAVLQYRALPDKTTGKLRCRPYLMDLGSTNGTYLNGIRLEEARYYELRKGDVVTLGQSSREYVLLTENTTGVSGA